MKDHVVTCQGTLSANSKPVYLLTSSVTLKVGSVIDLPYKVFQVNSQHGVKQQKFVVQVVQILNSRTSKIPSLMQFLRNLLFSAARCSFSFSGQHILAVLYQIADALSRFRWQKFRQLAPGAQPTQHRFFPSFYRN